MVGNEKVSIFEFEQQVLRKEGFRIIVRIDDKTLVPPYIHERNSMPAQWVTNFISEKIKAHLPPGTQTVVFRADGRVAGPKEELKDVRNTYKGK